MLKRKEQYLAYLQDKTNNLPTPSTREEKLLYDLCLHDDEEDANSGGGASSWNDLTGKPFGTVYGPRKYCEYKYNGSWSDPIGGIADSENPQVKLSGYSADDGTYVEATYDCELNDWYIPGVGITNYYIGNPKLYPAVVGGNAGSLATEPFCIYYDELNEKQGVVVDWEKLGITNPGFFKVELFNLDILELYHEPLSSEYLPKAGYISDADEGNVADILNELIHNLRSAGYLDTWA